MRLMKLKSPLWSLLVAALLLGRPCLGLEAQARGGGGGYHGGGGFGGGSFRGGEAYRGPGGQTAYRRPGGNYPANINVNRNVIVSRNWNAYRGPGYGGVAAGAAAGLAVGAVVGALPAAAAARSVAGQTYYYDGGNYYQPCYQGTDVNYCVVQNPN